MAQIPRNGLRHVAMKRIRHQYSTIQKPNLTLQHSCHISLFLSRPHCQATNSTLQHSDYMNLRFLLHRAIRSPHLAYSTLHKLDYMSLYPILVGPAIISWATTIRMSKAELISTPSVICIFHPGSRRRPETEGSPLMILTGTRSTEPVELPMGIGLDGRIRNTLYVIR
jgi:hypothetical protein